MTLSTFGLLATILLLAVLILYSVFRIMPRYKHAMLNVCFVFVVIGFLLYSYGYLPPNAGIVDIPFVIMRGMFSTARMFFLNNDYNSLINVYGAQWLGENIWWQTLFWACHVSAAIIMQAALFYILGPKLIGYFRMHLERIDEVYIIKGSDKYAFMLGEDIATKDAERKHTNGRRLVVFLLEEDEEMKRTDDYMKRISENAARFGGIIRVEDWKKDFRYYLNYLKNPGRRKFWGRRVKHKIILTRQDLSVLDDVREIVTFGEKWKIDRENLDIFVFASSEWNRSKMEAMKSAYPIHIVNEIELMLRRMIEEYPPWECPRLDFKGGKASRNFSVMILGFGPVGQAALLRLIMSGQFIGQENKDGKENSPQSNINMSAIVVDKKVDDLRIPFEHRYPAIDICCKVDYEPSDVQCDTFFKLLKDKIDDIDYIVVALSDDEINKQAAMDIRLLYERESKDMPFIAVFEKNGCLCNTEQDDTQYQFGCRDKIYKESVIIREELDCKAKAVHEVYGGKPWHELGWFLQESNRASADFISAMLKLAGLEEKDAREKNMLTSDNDLAETLAITEHYRWMAFHVAMGYRPMSIQKMEQRYEEYKGDKNPSDHLEFCRRDSKAKLQVSLVPWDDLDDVSKAYQKLAYKASKTYQEPEHNKVIAKELKRNFKDNDRSIIMNIPKYLKQVKSNTNKNDAKTISSS